MTYQFKIDAVLRRADEFLHLLSDMLTEQQSRATQRASAQEGSLVKQLEYAIVVIEDRVRDVRGALAARDVARVVHELWGLGGDMSHLDFDVAHLRGVGAFRDVRDELSMSALTLTKALSSIDAQQRLMSELN